MGIKAKAFSVYTTMVVVVLFVGFQGSVDGRHVSNLIIEKPDHTDTAAFASWLVSQNSWGVLNTISSDMGGAPFGWFFSKCHLGNVASYSDGLPNDPTGIPYFYLSTLDPTPRYGLQDPRASFTISEFSLGTCGRKDPENPTCSRITLTGKNHSMREVRYYQGIQR